MLAKIFIARPRFAGVISLVVMLIGALALLRIPVSEFPEITPPEVLVDTSYPGANAATVEDSVAAPIEAQVNGVDDMLYMSSTSTNDGRYRLSVTFKVGTNPDIAQVNVQNRVQLAFSRLPSEVTQQGVNVRKQSPSLFLVVNVFSPDRTFDSLFLSNYTTINIRDALARIDGIGEASIFGALDYGMRVWLDPDRMTNLGITVSDVIDRIREQNLQASVGQIGAPPSSSDQPVQLSVLAKGRLRDAEEFGQIILRTNTDGAVLRLRDVARIELGAQSYRAKAKLNGVPGVAMGLYLAPGANALSVANAVKSELKRLEPRFPEDIEAKIIYDTTAFVRANIREVAITLLITFVLVFAVTFLFLQDWRQTLVPTVAIPVSLIGTFAVLLPLGFSANTQTLFGLILAIGIVVDDAIVVIENVQRLMADEQLSPRDAALKAMQQVSGPIIATTLVLLAVFVPVGLLPGITGELYRQFAVTISVAVVLSSLVALTLSPALCAILLKPPSDRVNPLFRLFNKVLDKVRNGYGRAVAVLVRRAAVSIVLVLGFLVVTSVIYSRLPTSFIPSEDKGYFFIDVQLPDAASLVRTE
ncbi:MAG: efflux RND transporter permease subunit, partial [Pseudomonadota bacterium]